MFLEDSVYLKVDLELYWKIQESCENFLATISGL